MPHRTNVHFGEEAEVIPPSPSGTRAAEVPPGTPALAPTATLAATHTAALTPAHTAGSIPDQAARVPTEARYAHTGVAYARTRSEAEPSRSPSNAPGSTAASNALHRRPGYAQTPYHRPASIESDGEEVTAVNVPPRPSAPARPSAPVMSSPPVEGSSPSHGLSSPSHGSTSSGSHGSSPSPSLDSSSSASHGSSPSPSQDTPRPSRPATQVSEATPRPPSHTITPSQQPTPRQPPRPHLYNAPPTTSSDQSTSSTSSSSDVRIHGLLAYRPNREPGLTWDFARSFNGNVNRAGINLNVPATQPATRGADIDIVTPCGIAHVSPRATDYVQVIDVLRSLHAHFNTRMTDAEYEEALSLCSEEEISSTFWTRCDAVRDADVRQREVSRGVLHLDSLLGKTRLAGLGKRRAPGEWELLTLPSDGGAAPGVAASS